jgi:hypothetical protein
LDYHVVQSSSDARPKVNNLFPKGAMSMDFPGFNQHDRSPSPMFAVDDEDCEAADDASVVSTGYFSRDQDFKRGQLFSFKPVGLNIEESDSRKDSKGIPQMPVLGIGPVPIMRSHSDGDVADYFKDLGLMKESLMVAKRACDRELEKVLGELSELVDASQRTKPSGHKREATSDTDTLNESSDWESCLLHLQSTTQNILFMDRYHFLNRSICQKIIQDLQQIQITWASRPILCRHVMLFVF